MMLDELKAYVVGLAGITYTVRLGFLPKGTDEAIAIAEVSGLASELGFGIDGIQYERPLIQIMVRGTAEDYATPRGQIELIYQGLPKVQAQTLTGGGTSGYYLTIIPRQSPFLLRIDEDRRPVLAFTADITKEPSA